MAFIALLLMSSTLSAQLKVGNNPTTINSNAVLEIESTNKGLLLPRVALSATTNFAPLTAHVEGMVVYNKATAGNVTPGYYYNDGSQWIRIGGSVSGADPSTDAWQDSSGRVHLATLSDGITARPAGTDFVALDNGAVSIGTAIPHASALLHLQATDKGVLLPHVPLDSLKDISTINAPEHGLIVFATGGLLTEAYYYWDDQDTSWVQFVDADDIDLRMVGNHNHLTQDAGTGSNGTAIGTQYNIALGRGTGANLGVGVHNIFMGRHAGGNIQSGSNNVALGKSALRNAPVASNNIAIGNATGTSLLDGFGNIAIGWDAELPIDSANNQLSIGNLIYGTGLDGRATNTSSGNIGIGEKAPTDKLDIGGTLRVQNLPPADTNDSDFVLVADDVTGQVRNSGKTLSALSSDTEPWFNKATSTAATTVADSIYHLGNVHVGTGGGSGQYAMTVGDANQVSGNYSLAVGANNVVQGQSSLAAGQNNSVSGIFSIVAGSSNIVSGGPALAMGGANHISGSQSAAFGAANQISGSGSMTVGSADTISGLRSLCVGQSNHVSGNNAFAMGNNNVVMGDNASVLSGSGHIVTANNTAVATHLTVTGTFTNSSDRRLKRNIAPTHYGLSEVLAMKPTQYRYRGEEHNKLSLGFIAQDMRELIPEVVIETDHETKYLGINYTELIPVLTKAIQELKTELDAEKEKNKLLAHEMTTMLSSLKKEVNEIKAGVRLKSSKEQQFGLR